MGFLDWVGLIFLIWCALGFAGWSVLFFKGEITEAEDYKIGIPVSLIMGPFMLILATVPRR